MNPLRQPCCICKLLALLLACVVIVGCSGSGSQRYEVSGNVTFAGEQISEGSIAFVPTEGTKGPKVGTNIKQGRYHIDRKDGPVAGRHRVEIVSVRKTGRKFNAGGTMLDQTMNIIPPKYCGETSQLVAEIKPRGKNVFDFDLTEQDEKSTDK